MAWISVITNAGAALLASYAQGGHTLNVTDASVGSGVVEDANLRLQTALTQEKDAASIVRKTTTDNATKFKIQVGAAEASVGAYTAHQIGLWANLDGGARTLLALAQDAAGGVGVPLKSVSPNFAFALYITVAVGNSGTISVTVDGGAFVTGSTLEEAIGEAVDALEDEIDAKADAADVYTQRQIAALLADKADCSEALSLTAAAANWSNAEPPTQTINATGVTASNNILVGPGSLTAAQREEMVAAQIACTAQGEGTITLTAYGEKPTSNLPITVIILG